MSTDIENQGGLPAGWEKSETINEIPYYLNHNDEVSQWDHPALTTLFQKFGSLDRIHYGAYRIAKKVRSLQVLSNMFLVTCQDIVNACKMLNITVKDTSSVSDVEILLRKLFNKIQQDLELSIELTLNILLKCCDSGRTGCLNMGSVIVTLLVLSRGTPNEKYKAMFGVFASATMLLAKNGAMLIYRNDVKTLLTAIVSITDCVGECNSNSSFSIVNVPGTLNTLVTEDPSMVRRNEFLSWMDRNPQLLVWLPAMTRIVLAETVKHEAKCAVCKVFPIVGLHFRCLKCLNTDLCENCFLTNKENRKHKFYHPTKEYCLATKSTDDVKDFATQIKNKFRRTRTNIAQHQLIPIASNEPKQTICDLTEVHDSIKHLSNRLKPVAIVNNVIEENEQGAGHHHISSTSGSTSSIGLDDDDDDNTAVATATQHDHLHTSNYVSIPTSTAELIDKGISVSTLEESNLGGEEEMLHRLTTRMEISFQSTLFEQHSSLMYLSKQVCSKGVDLANLMTT